MKLAALLVALLWWGMGPPAAQGEPADLTVISRNGSLVIERRAHGRDFPFSLDSFPLILSRGGNLHVLPGQLKFFPSPFRAGGFGQPSSSGCPLPDPYLESLIRKYALRYGVDPALVRAVIRHESGFNPRAVSPKGAQGLMQLMPGTAALMGVTNPFDPDQNLAGGVGYLRYCLDRFGQNLPLAIAAYNAGPERVAKSQGIPPIAETRNFVRNVLNSYGKPVPAASPGPGGQGLPAPRLEPQGPPRTPKALKTADPKDPGPARPRPKIIEVRYPHFRQVAVATPQRHE